MVAVICTSVLLFAFIVTVNFVSCEVDRGLKVHEESNVDEFEIPSDDRSAKLEEDGLFTNDSKCAYFFILSCLYTYCLFFVVSFLIHALN